MWNQRDLIAVETAIASGEIEVHYSDRSVRYRSVDELINDHPWAKRVNQLEEKYRGQGHSLNSLMWLAETTWTYTRYYSEYVDYCNALEELVFTV